jgi:hypothetical protein
MGTGQGGGNLQEIADSLIKTAKELEACQLALQQAGLASEVEGVDSD